MNRNLEAQAALLQSREELLKIFVKSVPAGVAMLDRDMRYLQVSDRWCADYSESIVRRYLDVRIRSFFLTFPSAGKKCIAVLLREKHCEPTKTAGIVKAGTTWVRWEIRPWRTPERDRGRNSDLRRGHNPPQTDGRSNLRREWQS